MFYCYEEIVICDYIVLAVAIIGIERPIYFVHAIFTG